MFKGNKILIVDEKGNKKRIFHSCFLKGIKIKFLSKNATVELHRPLAKYRQVKIICGENAYIKIGASKHLIEKFRLDASAKNSTCIIGNNFSSHECNFFLNKEPNLKIEIGEDVMIADKVRVRTTDSHTVYDKVSGEILNFGRDVKIGNHVWLAYGAIVLKGVTIADDIVISTKSLVNKDCLEQNTVYAGVPAKAVKKNVNWDRKIPVANQGKQRA